MDGKSNHKLKAILFDLDGTLIHVDLDKFIPQYLRLLAQSVAHLVSPKEFIAKILRASKSVEESDGSETNEEVYAKAFFPLKGYSREEIEPYFDKFYEHEFSKLRQYTRKKPEARSVVQNTFEKGYDVVIATTPLLPETAILQRLEWAGVSDFPYRLITTIENSYATKTLANQLYYEQILEYIGYPAENCLMVGDEAKDMIAAKLGMQTFFIIGENGELDKSIPEPTYKGSLADLKSKI